MIDCAQLITLISKWGIRLLAKKKTTNKQTNARRDFYGGKVKKRRKKERRKKGKQLAQSRWEGTHMGKWGSW